MQGRSSYPRPDKTLPLKIVSLKTSPSDNNNFLRMFPECRIDFHILSIDRNGCRGTRATATAAAPLRCRGTGGDRNGCRGTGGDRKGCSRRGATAKGVAAGGRPMV